MPSQKQIAPVLVMIPTLNEAENIARQIEETLRFVPQAHVLVIDDDSRDGTSSVVEEVAQRHPAQVHLLVRKGERGLGTAYLRGMNWGLERSYQTFVEMDADGSHDAAHLPAMLLSARNHDVVIGSRYVDGGSTVNWGLSRRLISRCGSLYSRMVLGLKIRDLTGGYNVWSRSSLLAIDLAAVRSEGYAFQIEMKYRAALRGCSLVEAPITFADRRIGQSKMSGKIVREAIFRVWQLRKLRQQ